MKIDSNNALQPTPKKFNRYIKKFILFLFLLISHAAFGEPQLFKPELFNFNGVGYLTTKLEVIKHHGEPKTTTAPNDECSFYSSGNPGGPYFVLNYPGFKYVGSKSQGYLLESIQFDSENKIIAYYKNMKLNGTVTKQDLIALFGEVIKDQPKKNTLHLYIENSDDGVVFSFKDEKLIKLEYWASC